MWHQCHGTPFYLFNSDQKEYEPYVNRLQHGRFTLLRADIYFPQDQQYTYKGHCVAYDERIINDTTPRTVNTTSTLRRPKPRNVPIASWMPLEATWAIVEEGSEPICSEPWPRSMEPQKQIIATTSLLHRSPTVNDPILPVTQYDLPLSGNRTTFSQRQCELHARIQRPWNTCSIQN